MNVRTDREAAFGRIFNARKPERRPAGVVFPRDEQEVVEAVRLARERGWGISVRSGKRGAAGASKTMVTVGGRRTAEPAT